ncbi:MAG TPA: hypothetical protein VML75_17445 [Kofleriaceae bacterium]|nr:hypothetical protein [Kofleriaceae bacterium]
MRPAIAMALSIFALVLLTGHGEVRAPAMFPGADASLLQAGEAPAQELPEHDGEAEAEASSSETDATPAWRDRWLRDAGELAAWPDAAMPLSHISPPPARPPIA